MNYKAKTLALRMAPRPLRRHIVFKRYRNEVEATGEPELMELHKLVKPGQLALDVGSNLGVYAYQLFRLTGRVIAFEPNPTLAAFVRSVFPNAVEVRQIALSAEDGNAELSIPLDADRGHGWASLKTGFVEGPVEKVAVATRRLDSMDLPTVSFIKIDVEGFERQVLQGGQQILARDLPTLLVEIDFKELSDIADLLGKSGYIGAFLYKKMWRPLGEFDPSLHQNMDIWRKTVAAAHTRRDLNFINNFLFLPPGRKISELN